MALLTPPFALGAAGQVLSGRLQRLALGAAWRPAGTGVQVVSGVLAGPANTQGELSLAGNVLTVQAFRAIIQSALDATVGSYVVPNDAPVSFTMTAQHASQFRRSLVVVRVDDSQVSGVASSGTTDRAVLEVIDGGLAASQAATVLPTPAGSWLALGEVLIPPVGQTITVTPYNPRTGIRHGILPVIADGTTVAGHDGAPGTAPGQYRDHPTRGLERWSGFGWGGPLLAANGGTSAALVGTTPAAGQQLITKTWSGTLTGNAQGDTTVTFPGGPFANGLLAFSLSAAAAAAGPYQWIPWGPSLAAVNARCYNGGVAVGSPSLIGTLIAVGW